MDKQKIYDPPHSFAHINENDISPTLIARARTGGGNVPLVLSHPQGAAARVYNDGKTGALTATKSSEPVICLAENMIGRKPENGPNGPSHLEGVSFTLNATGVPGVSTEKQVRKLTPIECERLQGFPDNYTKIPYRGKPSENCPDAPRYKALGNSWAVPVVRWIGERINLALKGL